ncbi:MAG: signal peptidase II [Erysipelotrichaceae bacterium]|nr:signal peptidase II [Erysipelotrichaceae bacterium]
MKLKEFVLLVLFLFIDQITKFIVSTNLNIYEPIVVIKNFFNITYAQNTGAAWSIFEGKTIVLTIVSFVVSCAMIYWLFKNKNETKIVRFSVLLMLSGAIGNFIDRLLLGYVIDFLDFYIFGYDFPIFNIADSLLCIGVGILLLSTFFEKEKING